VRGATTVAWASVLDGGPLKGMLSESVPARDPEVVLKCK